MGIFLSKAMLVLAFAQSPVPPPADSTRASLWARVTADSTDGPAWLDLGRYYLRTSVPTRLDTVRAHAMLDTAQQAFLRAARWSTGTRTADSAQVFRVYTYGERAYEPIRR